MYETFYRLNANPFRLTPDPRFCFSHSGYKRAREYLVYALRLGEGFIVVTGQPGTGKTTLAETFLKELEISKIAAERIVAPNLGATGLLRSVAFAFGLPAENIDRATLRSQIEQYFTRQVRSGRRVLLIIDEAQGLPHSALEELRLLADLQSGTQSLLQIFLIGQNGLRDLLQVPEMDPFQQRVIATCHLQPLVLTETSAYIKYRLTQAGWKGDPEFTGEAVLSIYRYSQGIPRHINKLCNRLLLIGYGKEKHTIDQEDVEEISIEMQSEKLTPIAGNKSDRADLSVAPLETELPDDNLTLDSLALRYEDAAIETLGMAGVAEPTAEPEVCVHPGETANWPVEVAAAASRPEQPQLQPASCPEVAENSGAALSRCSKSVKHGFQTIGHLQVKSVLMAVVLLTAFVSTVALTQFGETQPVAGSSTGIPAEKPAAMDDRQVETVELVASLPETPAAVHHRRVETVEPVASLPETPAAVHHRRVETVEPVASSPETPAAVHDRQVETVEPVASLQDTAMTVNKAVSLVTPVEKPVVVTPEPAETSSVVAGPPRPVTAAPSTSPVPVTETRETRIARLLGRAQQSLESDRLTVPAGDNASLYYHKVLALDPGNRAALDGINRVAGRYAELASRARGRQDTDKVRLYLERGLRVQPDNAELLVLKTTMDQPPASGVEVIDRSIIASSDPPNQLFTKIKDLLGSIIGTAR